MSFTSTSFRAKIALILTLSISPLLAQQDLSTYGMTFLPQSLYNNPTADTEISFYLVLPMLHQNVSLRNTGFSPYDILAEGTNVNDNIRNAVLDLRPEDAFQVQTKSTLFDVGFSLGNKALMSFGSHLVSSSHLSYPSELIQQVYFTGQNYLGETLSFKDFDIQASLRMEHRLGLQVPLPSLNLVVGGSLRYIQGIAFAGIDQDFTNIGIERIDDQTMDISLKAGILSTDIPNQSDLRDGLPGSGWGLDLGLRYDYKKWNFSASMAGGSRINWKIKEEYQVNTNVRYTGVQWDNTNPDEISYPSEFDEPFAIDTISSGRVVSQTVASKYFLSARYALSKRQHLTFLYNSDPLTKKRLNTLGVQYNTQLLRSVGLHIGALHNRVQTSISTGLSFRLLGFQLYAAVSNAGIVYNYYDTQELNVSFGLNWVSFRARDKKVARRKAKAKKKEEKVESTLAPESEPKKEEKQTREEKTTIISPDTIEFLPPPPSIDTTTAVSEDEEELEKSYPSIESKTERNLNPEQTETTPPPSLILPPPATPLEEGKEDSEAAAEESTNNNTPEATQE